MHQQHAGADMGVILQRLARAQDVDDLDIDVGQCAQQMVSPSLRPMRRTASWIGPPS